MPVANKADTFCESENFLRAGLYIIPFLYPQTLTQGAILNKVSLSVLCLLFY